MPKPASKAGRRNTKENPPLNVGDQDWSGVGETGLYPTVLITKMMLQRNRSGIHRKNKLWFRW